MSPAAIVLLLMMAGLLAALILFKRPRNVKIHVERAVCALTRMLFAACALNSAGKAGQLPPKTPEQIRRHFVTCFQNLSESITVLPPTAVPDISEFLPRKLTRPTETTRTKPLPISSFPPSIDKDPASPPITTIAPSTGCNSVPGVPPAVTGDDTSTRNRRPRLRLRFWRQPRPPPESPSRYQVTPRPVFPPEAEPTLAEEVSTKTSRDAPGILAPSPSFTTPPPSEVQECSEPAIFIMRDLIARLKALPPTPPRRSEDALPEEPDTSWVRRAISQRIRRRVQSRGFHPLHRLSCRVLCVKSSEDSEGEHFERHF